MLSKSLPWDFIVKFPKTMEPAHFGIHAFLIEEPYLERILLDRVPKNEISFSIYSGNEITRDFIEEHFINLSFFESSDHIQVLNAETMSPASLDFLLESQIDFSDRYLIMFFSKSTKAFTEFVKNKNVMGYEVELPRFWEGAKLWQFCQKACNSNYDGLITRFALENLEHNFESFVWLIDTLKMNFPEGVKDISLLSALVVKERWDFFELIELFHLRPQDFFYEILKKETDYEWLRGLSAFMQTHLTKILFPEEARAKAKPSKYDQTIIAMSEKLNRSMVKKYLSFFSDLEIMAKSNDPFLVDKIRLELLK